MRYRRPRTLIQIVAKRKEIAEKCQQIASPCMRKMLAKVRFFLHLVKVNHEVNLGILACDWWNAWLTSWLTLTRCRKDQTLVTLLTCSFCA